jgi:ribulose-phosphate 3-epimerase
MDSRFDRAELARDLRNQSPSIMASLLFCDFLDLRREIEAVEEAGAAAMHLDVMDGHFVPNFTYGMTIVEAARRATDKPIDCHLMMDNPGRYVEDFRRAGADNMTIHIEAVPDPRPVLDKIRSLGSLAGLALNPPTPLSAIEPYLPYCDLILVMSVMPGIGGQHFDDEALGKLQALKSRPDVTQLLEVDGGVAIDTIGKCAAAGADLFVTGSALFRHDDYKTAIHGLRDAATHKQ